MKLFHSGNNVLFHLLPSCNCWFFILRIFEAFKNIAIQWIALFRLRTIGPWWRLENNVVKLFQTMKGVCFYKTVKLHISFIKTLIISKITPAALRADTWPTIPWDTWKQKMLNKADEVDDYKNSHWSFKLQ